ncbi:MAG TPA: hypothetical protein VMV35_03125 [Halothiobacillus sp.]|nr:hypothetical protein [Halothiobacillus sp.]
MHDTDSILSLHFRPLTAKPVHLPSALTKVEHDSSSPILWMLSFAGMAIAAITLGAKIMLIYGQSRPYGAKARPQSPYQSANHIKYMAFILKAEPEAR